LENLKGHNLLTEPPGQKYEGRQGWVRELTKRGADRGLVYPVLGEGEQKRNYNKQKKMRGGVSRIPTQKPGAIILDTTRRGGQNRPWNITSTDGKEGIGKRKDPSLQDHKRGKRKEGTWNGRQEPPRPADAGQPLGKRGGDGQVARLGPGGGGGSVGNHVETGSKKVPSTRKVVDNPGQEQSYDQRGESSGKTKKVNGHALSYARETRRDTGGGRRQKGKGDGAVIGGYGRCPIVPQLAINRNRTPETERTTKEEPKRALQLSQNKNTCTKTVHVTYNPE